MQVLISYPLFVLSPDKIKKWGLEICSQKGSKKQNQRVRNGTFISSFIPERTPVIIKRA